MTCGGRVTQGPHSRIQVSGCGLIIVMLIGLVSEPGFGADVEMSSNERLLRAACMQCHGLAPIINRRDGYYGWKATIDEMILRGAQLDAEEAESVAEYLVAKFGPAAGRVSDGRAQNQTQLEKLPVGTGRELIITWCQMCHELGRVVNTRRKPDAWARYVVSMLSRMRPAPTDTQIDEMTTYLIQNFSIPSGSNLTTLLCDSEDCVGYLPTQQ